MLVLGIESSCDETGVALYDSERGLLAEALHSQAALHANYGGVVPELASRDHVRRSVTLLRQACAQAQVGRADIDAVAYTAGPGLPGALMVGACLGRAVAMALDVPALGVHHLEAHLLAPMMAGDAPESPFTLLLVSGGHTQLVRVEGPGRYQLLGQTLDDAAGEAFDKVARMLDLGYPGGPAIAAAAAGAPAARPFPAFPRPMMGRKALDFSFSGLKTHVRRLVEKLSAEPAGMDQGRVAAVAAEFEAAVVESLAERCGAALARGDSRALLAAGGVAANRRLRAALAALAERAGVGFHCPPPALCTDNGAMIAYAGSLRLAAGQSEPLSVAVRPRWPLQDLEPFEVAA